MTMFIKKSLAVLVLASALFLTPVATSAQSTDALLLQLQQLLALVQQLQQQLATLEGTTTSNTLNLTRSLYIGIRGDDVSQLQTFLRTTGDFTYPEITGYYGNVTAQAVQRYQCREMNICAGSPTTTGYGVVGPKTRASIRAYKGNITTNTCPVFPPSPCAPGYHTERDVDTNGCSLAPICVLDVTQVVTYSWNTTAWSSCQSNTQTRSVTCKGSNNATYSDTQCTQAKPAEQQVCSTNIISKSCSLDGATVQHSGNVTAYTSVTKPYGQICESTTRVCNDGVLSGNNTYQYTSCSVAPRANVGWLRGIHYAVERNDLHTKDDGVDWKDKWRNPEGCDAASGCVVDFDNRISAVHLRYKWGHLNPGEGIYNFEDLGSAIDEIHRSGKKATIVVMAGKYTPSWLMDKEIVRLGITAKFFNIPDYSQAYIPAPWDPLYLDSYENMIRAMSEYFKENPSRYETVALIKNGGVVVHSGETRLMPVKAFFPAKEVDTEEERNQKQILLCEEWAKIGYKESKVLSAFDRISSSIRNSFPDKYIGLAFVVGSKRFPTINSSGKCVVDDGNIVAKNSTLETIIKSTVFKYGNRAVINDTVLGVKNGNPPILQWAKDNGAIIGFQLNAQQVGCRDGVSGCNIEDLEQTLQRGIDVGGSFIEVHNGNIHRHKDILRTYNAMF